MCSLKGQNGDYTCKCLDGFVGDDCGFADPCLNVACHYGGVCSVTIQDTVVSGDCICSQGYQYVYSSALQSLVLTNFNDGIILLYWI